MRRYTRAQVAEHNREDDLWVIIDQKVYDVTEWINFHPGGRDALLEMAGADATEMFNEIGHSEFAREKMKRFCVGVVASQVRYNASEYKDRQEKKKKKIPNGSLLFLTISNGGSGENGALIL